ncbi:hypothetical protein T439DRAFT_356320 [Meredithblackwellia eburnea MCA 4105]
MFSLLTPTPVHDICALCAGLYTVVGLSFAVRHFSSNGFLSKVSIARIKTFWSTLATLLVTNVVLPLLTSLFVSSYVGLPLTGISLGGPQEEAKLLASRCHGLAQKWLGSLREAEYLIERRLRNYEGATT